MSNLVKDQTKQEILDTIAEVRNLGSPTATPRRRVVRSSGGGAQRPWIEITTVTDKDNYIGKVLTSPDDSTELATGVTIKSVPSSEGLLKVGDTFFADLIGSTYYISPSIFYGS